jgi:hypothetical protein
LVKERLSGCEMIGLQLLVLLVIRIVQSFHVPHFSGLGQCNIIFKDILWNGVYRLDPYPLWDFAGRWTKNMFNGEFNILSFQLKKRIPIGRGGMILTNDRKAAEWLRKARYDGRNLRINYIKNNYSFLGWHYYMTPEDAARGILLMDKTPSENKDLFSYKNYNDLSKFRIFK